MKIQFKQQAYQTHAVEAVVNVFAGQPLLAGLTYRMDKGMTAQASLPEAEAGFKNSAIQLTHAQLLANIQTIQHQQNLPRSEKLETSKICPINLDVEMETGTGKTYCYIKTAFELNKQYGWSKFIVVVPSIAIREGVYKSLDITTEHFLQTYGKKARFFIYNSKQLHQLESFSSDAGINIMVINVQAFNATGKDNRRIYEVLDDFQSRKPIDVIAANRPILILDEPQKMEGAKTLDSLQAFKPLLMLHYSATHKTTHHKIHRLDALDAYHQKLVKKIEVRGIKCVASLHELRVAHLQYTVKTGEQKQEITVDTLERGDAFKLSSSETQHFKQSIHSTVEYDLVGKLAAGTQLTRKTIAQILRAMNNAVFDQFRFNPEHFIAEAIRLINEQKATMVIEHIAYNPIDESFDLAIFTASSIQTQQTGEPLKRHIYDYLVSDSSVERNFARELDIDSDVVVYAKLPKTFYIPTPVGDYNPDWAIVFHADKVKHIYFIAETKGSMSSMELREIEKCKTQCAKKFFATISEERVKYDVVNNYENLMRLVKA